MHTYKINCTICYDICTETLDNCTKYNCDACAPTMLFSNTCLGSCCIDLLTNTQFSVEQFNRCYENDAAEDNTINIGLTIGLVIGVFLFPLFCIGCIYVVASKKNQDEKKSTKKPVEIACEDMKTVRSSRSLVTS
jgi:hypothetical protein